MMISMSRKIFIDTSAFIALTNSSDQYHLTAVDCLNQLRASGSQFVTTNFILDETYTRLRRRAGLKTAIIFGEKIKLSKETKIYTIDKIAEKLAWDIFKKYEDQPFSYTDCTSFAVMRLKKMREAFCFDKDFRAFGWITLPAV